MPAANRHPMGRAASPSMPMNVGCLGRLGIRGSRSQHHATPCRHRLLLGRAMLGSFRAVHRVIVDFLVSVVCVHGVASGLREVFIDRDLECDAPWRRQPERRWPKESPGYRHPRSVALYRRCRTAYARAGWHSVESVQRHGRPPVTLMRRDLTSGDLDPDDRDH